MRRRSSTARHLACPRSRVARFTNQSPRGQSVGNWYRTRLVPDKSSTRRGDYMPAISRINTPISNAELERRWSAVRDRMADQGIDVLVCQANNDYMGGAVRYLS